MLQCAGEGPKEDSKLVEENKIKSAFQMFDVERNTFITLVRRQGYTQ